MPTAISPSLPPSRPPLRASDIQDLYHPIGTIHLEGQVDEPAPELLHKLVHSHSPVEELPEAVTYGVGGLEVEKIALEVQRLKRIARPWWRRFSPTWFLALGPLSTLASTALVAPRLQLYTHLVCKEVNVGQWDLTNGAQQICNLWARRPYPAPALQTLSSRRKWQCFSRVCVIPCSNLKPVFYQIRFGHGDGTRHFRLLDNDLLGIVLRPIRPG